MMKIYYNNIAFIDEDNTIEIYKDCPFIEVEEKDVDACVYNNFDKGDWDCYVIPYTNYCDYKVIFLN